MSPLSRPLGYPVVACTQTANTRSMALLRRTGFTETGLRFIEFDAEQALWHRSTRRSSGV